MCEKNPGGRGLEIKVLLKKVKEIRETQENIWIFKPKSWQFDVFEVPGIYVFQKIGDRTSNLQLNLTKIWSYLNEINQMRLIQLPKHWDGNGIVQEDPEGVFSEIQNFKLM